MVLVVRTLKESRDSLLAVGYLSAGYIFVSSLIIFNVEPQTFPSFFMLSTGLPILSPPWAMAIFTQFLP